MFIIAIGDWFLARSEAFKLLMKKIRDHNINTKKSFSKVKEEHKKISERLNNHEKEIEKLKKIIQDLQEEQPPILKIKRKSDSQ